MPHVLDMLKSEHKTMSRLLTSLECQVDLFEEAEHLDYELMKEIIDYFLTYPDLCHHPKEDLVLATLAERNLHAAEQVGALVQAHQDISRELHEFAHALSNVLLELDVPREAFVNLARTFIDRERRHMDQEEKIFFPAAQQHLTDDDWAALERQVFRVTDPLGDLAKARRFEKLAAL